MRPTWFNDSIPLDQLIAPMVLFFQNNGITTIQSCEGGGGTHLYGKPTITFKARTLKEIDRMNKLLHKNELDTSLEIGLMTGFFADVKGWGRYGLAQWIWTTEGGDGKNYFKETVYDRVIDLVNMNEIKDITRDFVQWIAEGYPTIG
jgi:hypothetical protein